MAVTSTKPFNIIFLRSKKTIKKKQSKRRTKIKHKPTYTTNHHDQENSNSAEIVGSNEDLMNIILSKLRNKYHPRCKIICRMWYRILSGHRFIPKLPPSHLLVRSYIPKTLFHTTKYWTIPLENNPKGGPSPPTPSTSHDTEPLFQFKSDQPHTDGMISISQSCNGLLLCPCHVRARKTNAYSNIQNCYVYNPKTNMKRYVPLPSKDGCRRFQVTAMYLAFDPSYSPHYKVVSLSKIHTEYVSFTQVDIYSSETDSWNVSKADFPKSCCDVDFSIGVFLNGSIHWPSKTGETSIYFHVDDECFKIMPMPPIQGGKRKRTLRYFGECGGTLLLIDFHESFNTKFDVFGMENDMSRWFVKYNVDLSSYRGSVVDMFYILSVIGEGDGDDMSLVIYVPGRERVGSGIMTYGLGERKEKKKLHSPVSGWDLRVLEEKGFSVVHPLIRTSYAV